MRNHRHIEAKIKSTEANKVRVAEVSSHPETIVVRRQDMPAPWAYIEDMFPSIAPIISKTIVYKNENTAFCRKIGIPDGVGGLFFIGAGAILICWTKEKVKDDVVICHEMLHYASQLLGGRMQCREAEENFAYSKSILYLVANGYSEDWIMKEYMLPYYLGMVLAKNRNQEQARLEAIETCRNMISFELGRPLETCDTEEVDRFDDI